MASFTIYWQGQPVPSSKDQIPTVAGDETVQERLWDTWCCVDAIVDDDQNYWWLDAEQLAEFVEENFLERAPEFAPLPPWLRQNSDSLKIDVAGSVAPPV